MTYANDKDHPIGKENLFRLWYKITIGQPISAFAYGDSTVAGHGEEEEFKVHRILPLLSRRSGLTVPLSITNRGVAGSRIGDLDAIGDLSSNPDLIIIKYGINDGSNPSETRLSTFRDGLNAKLAEIRAQRSLADLCILLVGPNSTSGATDGRNAEWYEQLRPVYEEAARAYQCAFFDTYAVMQDSTRAAGKWYVDPYHPGNIGAAWIWASVADWIFGGSECSPWSKKAIVLASGWQPFGDVWEQPTARMLPGGTVKLSGLVKSGQHLSESLIGMCPPGWAPVKHETFLCNSASGPVGIHIAPDGGIRAHTDVNPFWTSLSGIQFDIV